MTLAGEPSLLLCAKLRALQGRTSCRSVDGVMSDESLESPVFLMFLEKYASNPDHPCDLYRGLSMILPLYLFGHHTKGH